MKKAYIIIIAILMSYNINAYEIKKISFWVQGFSIHSAWNDNDNPANERHENKGVCVDFVCYMDFTNSFGNPGEALFLNLTPLDMDYAVAGIRMGLIWGYEPSPLPFFMPYVGVGYMYIWAEATYIPSPEEAEEYLLITLIRLEVYNKKW